MIGIWAACFVALRRLSKTFHNHVLKGSCVHRAPYTVSIVKLLPGTQEGSTPTAKKCMVLRTPTTQREENHIGCFWCLIEWHDQCRNNKLWTWRGMSMRKQLSPYPARHKKESSLFCHVVEFNRQWWLHLNSRVDYSGLLVTSSSAYAVPSQSVTTG